MKILEDSIVAILNFFFSFTNNYGIAIVLFTIVLKIALQPLTKKQFESMNKMKIVQPKIKALQEQHKNNPQQFQKEVMQLYKKENVNPMGGCLPMLLQLPIMIGLFIALSSQQFKEQVLSSGKAGFLWIVDITARHPQFFNEVTHDWTILILPILVGISTYFTQKTMGNTEPSMAPIMTMMPVLMVFVSFSLPAGVLLYWVVSNLLSAWQQGAVAVRSPQDPIEVKKIK